MGERKMTEVEDMIKTIQKLYSDLGLALYKLQMKLKDIKLKEEVIK